MVLYSTVLFVYQYYKLAKMSPEMFKAFNNGRVNKKFHGIKANLIVK